MSILFHSTFGPQDEWLAEMRGQLPDDTIVTLDQVPTATERAEVEFMVIWDLPVSEMATFPNLRAILLTGSGGSHLRPFEALPQVPIVRLVDQTVAADMAAHALHWIIHFQRRFDAYTRQQQQSEWRVQPFEATADHLVGILGHGNIGGRVAEVCRTLGYPVRTWSRSPKPAADIETFTGPDQLDAFLGGVRCLVNVLPLTAETRKLLDARRIALLPEGASLINIGRGGTIDDDALISALDAGHLNGAALDVFRQEPLEPDSPFWAHPGIHVTPHSSGAAQPRSSVGYIAANIGRIRAGEAAHPLFDPARGY